LINKGAESSLEKVRRDLDAILPSRNNSNTTKITIAAGGIGVWIAVAMFAFMVGLNWSLNTKLSDQERKIERLEDYLAAIYRQSPQLLPEDYGK
jgi:hypothetical protein